MLPFDLHVLGLPLAFILSQDQTLHRSVLYTIHDPRPVALSGCRAARAQNGRSCLP